MRTAKIVSILAAFSFSEISAEINIQNEPDVRKQKHDHNPGKRLDGIMTPEHQVVYKIESQPNVEQIKQKRQYGPGIYVHL